MLAASSSSSSSSWSIASSSPGGVRSDGSKSSSTVVPRFLSTILGSGDAACGGLIRILELDAIAKAQRSDQTPTHACAPTPTAACQIRTFWLGWRSHFQKTGTRSRIDISIEQYRRTGWAREKGLRERNVESIERVPGSQRPYLRSHGSATQYPKYNQHILLQLPFSVVEWTHVTRFEPARDAVEVERVLCDMYRVSPNHTRRYQDPRRTLQIPHAAVHSSLVAETWFA